VGHTILKFADYSQVVTADQLDAALRAGAFEAVCHYLGGDFALRVEDPRIVADIRARNWPQMGIFVPLLGSVNGAADAQGAISTYGVPRGSLHWLDIEPMEFDQDPSGWAAAADRWCDEMRAAQLSPGVYGVDRTVAACGNHADHIWRAVPGECDPAGPGLDPAFFAHRRAVQCDQGVFGGVVMDVNFSEFAVSLPTPAPTPTPTVVEEVMPVTTELRLPDGTLATWELLRDATVRYTQTDPNNFDILARAPLPGSWLSIERVGIFQGEAFFRGTGVDGKLWQTTLALSPNSAWTDPVTIA